MNKPRPHHSNIQPQIIVTEEEVKAETISNLSMSGVSAEAEIKQLREISSNLDSDDSSNFFNQSGICQEEEPNQAIFLPPSRINQEKVANKLDIKETKLLKVSHY